MRFVCVIALAAVACQNHFAEDSGSKIASPSVKKLMENPENFLGTHIAVRTKLDPETKTPVQGVELTVRADGAPLKGRIRFLASTAFAEPVSQIESEKFVRIIGIVLADETRRGSYVFEVESIEVLGTNDEIIKTIQPKSSSLPAVNTPEIVEKEPEKAVQTPGKVENGATKNGVSTVLVVSASLVAVLLMVLMVIGLRLMKYAKLARHQPQQKPLEIR